MEDGRMQKIEFSNQLFTRSKILFEADIHSIIEDRGVASLSATTRKEAMPAAHDLHLEVTRYAAPFTQSCYTWELHRVSSRRFYDYIDCIE